MELYGMDTPSHHRAMEMHEINILRWPYHQIATISYPLIGILE